MPGSSKIRDHDEKSPSKKMIALVLALIIMISTISALLFFDRSEDDIKSYIDNRVPELLDRYDIPGASISLVEDGELNWSDGYGNADKETGSRVTNQTLFRVQSITKSVTAWGIMNLTEAGDIDLDSAITEYIPKSKLPDSDYSWSEVTTRRLLSHSAGFPEGYYSNYPPEGDIPSLEEALKGETGAPSARPVFSPGTRFQYSNPGYALLELLIEEVTKRDYAEYMRTEILEPIGMETATFEIKEAIGSGLVTTYERDGTPVPIFHEPVSAQGMLYASAEDIGAFVAAGMEGEEAGREVLSSDSVSIMYSPEIKTTGYHGYGSDSYGLGHLIETLSGGQKAVAHGGQGTGSWTWYHSVPEKGDGIVILTNSERSLRLISDVLGEWAETNGLSSLSLTSTYSLVENVVRVAVVMSAVFVLGLASKLAHDVYHDNKVFDPLSQRYRVKRSLSAVLSISLLTLWWVLGYSIMDLFLPWLADWLGVVLSMTFGLLFFTALFISR